MAEELSSTVSSNNSMTAENNPFDFEDPSDASTAADYPAATKKSPNRQHNRGSLISGIMPTSSNNGGETSRSVDVESCMEPPDSDFASRAPHTVWQPSTISSSDSRAQQPQTAPAVKNGKIHLPSTDKRKNRLLIALVLAVVVLIGAIAAVSFLMFGNNSSATPEATRQEVFTETIAKVSNATDLENPESAQSKAQSWLISVDELWKGEESTIPEMRIIQRYALAVFYFATNGTTAWRDNNWMAGDECDSSVPWDYIECNENNQLRAIAFDGMGLQGSIPSEMASLVSLENLILKNERGLTGSIPPALGQLANLKQLGLYYAGLTGRIPVELFNATSLKYVNLQDNGLTGGIPSEISALSNLETLVLMSNQFSGEIPWQSLVATGAVQLLGLSNNLFTGGIPAVVQDFSDLRYLYLDHNNMNGTVPVELGSVLTLRSINFDNNSLSGNLPSYIGNLHSLEYLSMQYNHFDGPLPTNLGLLLKLKTLSLGANDFTGSLPALTAMPDLKNIYLFENGLNGSIPESIFQLESLEMLFLSSNNLSGYIPSFPAGQSQSRLRGLYLSDNQLQGQIPESVCDLKYLEALFLDENQLSGFLPRCLGRLTKLTQLYAFRNELYGNVPEEFSRLEELLELGLEVNNMTGVVPDAVCALSDEQKINFWADCNSPNNTSLECPCCTSCCPASEGCA